LVVMPIVRPATYSLLRTLRQGVVKPLRPVKWVLNYLELPAAAKAERRQDRVGVFGEDPGLDRAIELSVGWLLRAQARSRSQDGGVARHYGLVTGWSSSYPETTGYIVPTLLDYARLTGDDTVRMSAKRMLDWLVAIQLPQGAYQGGLIDSRPPVPVTFNTGQILLGLAAGAHEWSVECRPAMRRAADWLVATQDPDGCWRKYATPFAAAGEKTYETHVAWGLLEAARLEPTKPYAERALANVRWALRFQRPNGWLEHCCLTDPSQPLTHTLGYALRGILEAYRFSREPSLLEATCRIADGLLSAMNADGSLPGRLREDWSGSVPWVCLTGCAQIAACWLMLYQETGDPRYLRAGCLVNRYLRRTIRVDGPDDTRGAVKGSFPVDGGYGTYQYLNWAAKFFVDTNLLERSLRQELKSGAVRQLEEMHS
jgi:squalene-hopene cyclase-like protein